MSILNVCGCYPIVSSSNSDHPACSKYFEGHAAVLIPATRAGQRGWPKFHPRHPNIFAGPKDRGEIVPHDLTDQVKMEEIY